MGDLRWSFLNTQALASAVAASLQRASVYEEVASPDDRRRFRGSLQGILVDLAKHYRSPISEKVHVQNIKELANRTGEAHGHILHGGCLRFGSAQKALNLYLKYLWCHGCIVEPPHCPFDSLVIGHLPASLRISWVKMGCASEYMRLVNAAREVAGDESLACWELRIYQAGAPK